MGGDYFLCEVYIMDWFFEFPEMERSGLRDFKKSIDFAFRDFSRTYGEGIESFFEPLLMFLVWFEKLFINTPWPIIIAGILLLAWFGSRSIPILIGTLVSFLLIGYFGIDLDPNQANNKIPAIIIGHGV